MRILLVEDDPRIGDQLARAIAAAGFVVDTTADGEEAWFLGDTVDYDGIVLDLGLPGMDGLQVLRRWREDGSKTPVLILSARGLWSERVEGIDAGADDYLAKPFRIEELLARLRALIRRSVGRPSPMIEAGGLTIDTRHMRVTQDGMPVALSALEYRLIAYLAHHKDRTVSPGEILDHLYGDADAREANALEQLVARLRRKLGAGAIETRRGFGYRLGPDDAG